MPSPNIDPDITTYPYHQIPAAAGIGMMHTRANPTAIFRLSHPDALTEVVATSYVLRGPASPVAKDDHAPDLHRHQIFNSGTMSLTDPCQRLHQSPRSIR